MSNIKAAVIGLGIMGQQHADTLALHPDVDVVAVADIRAQIAEDLGASLGAVPYADYGDMLKAHSPDLVVVTTPDPVHLEPVLAAVDAGATTILQEKPFATTVADATEMYEAVERKGVQLYINFANRASELDIATNYVIKEGLIGDVVYGEMRLDDNISVPTDMWGDRTREWTGSSSVAHFLLSHVVDLLRWQLKPAEVTDVYAVSQRRVLGYTQDVFDAFLTFDSGTKIRVKAEWIKHIDSLVEFYQEFSGSEGTIIYNRRPGFGGEPGWRANLSAAVDLDTADAHRETLAKRGVNVASLAHRLDLSSGHLTAGSGEIRVALEQRGAVGATGVPLVNHIVDAILEGTAEPAAWKGNGPLPGHVDGLRQTQVVTAIMESAEKGEPVSI
jgi:predicted dehydrogenase